MGLLDMLTVNSQVQAGFQDFLKRFQEGPPSEGYDDHEVMDRYGQVATGQLHQQPGLLHAILGGLTGSSAGSSSGGGSIFSNPIAKAAMAGITAMVVKKVLGGSR